MSAQEWPVCGEAPSTLTSQPGEEQLQRPPGLWRQGPTVLGHELPVQAASGCSQWAGAGKTAPPRVRRSTSPSEGPFPAPSRVLSLSQALVHRSLGQSDISPWKTHLRRPVPAPGYQGKNIFILAQIPFLLFLHPQPDMLVSGLQINVSHSSLHQNQNCNGVLGTSAWVHIQATLVAVQP